ncbi:NADH-quinone oxidoreductase subunit C [Streptomyces paradoxus]|uniref:NADH-quinone oxidoreductase subunit C n=1 Tax=Streptomyces paradoxus TaxID=66375 RepID=UPI00363A0501
MTAVGWLPSDAEELFGPDATAEESYEVLTVDVPPAAWITALETARDRLGCTYFDWLSAVDEPGTGFRVTAHVAALSPLRRLLLRTTVPQEAPALPSAVGVYAGAAWHERETHEMFGITFEGHPALDHLLLPENFEGHPLRKDFVLAARVAKAWPGAKEPGESEHGGPKRRQMLPPGVPDPNEWGPLKGQLPPAPARPARGTARPAGERPVRRTRSASGGSASQSAAGTETPAAGSGASAAGTETPAAGSGAAVAGSATPAAGGEAPVAGAEAPAAVRRSRSAAEGSASQSPPGEPTAPAPTGPRRNRSASQGPVSQQPSDQASPTPGSESEAPGSKPEAPGSEPPTAGSSTPSAGPRRARSASEGSASRRTGSDRGDSRPGRASTTPHSSDAPWHHARPAFDEPAPEPSPEAAQLPDPEPSNGSQTSEPADTPEPSGDPEPADTPEPSGDPKAASDAADSPDTGTSDSPDTPENPAGGPQ